MNQRPILDLSLQSHRELWWKMNRDQVERVKRDELIDFVSLCLALALIVLCGGVL